MSKRRRTKPHKAERIKSPPEDAIADVATMLADVSLTFLLRLNALLSWQEATSGNLWAESSAFSTLTSPLIQNLLRATIESESEFAHAAQPSIQFFLTEILWTVNKAQDGPPSTAKAIPTMTLEQVTRDVLAPRLRQQWTLDARRMHATSSRMYALLVHYPDIQRELFQQKMGADYVDLSVKFRERYGISLAAVLVGTLFMHHRGARLFIDHPVFTPDWIKGTAPQSLGIKDLERYIVNALPSLSELDIPVNDLAAYFQSSLKLTETEVSALIGLLMTDIETLRVQIQQVPYSVGVKAFAPLPTERRPLIRLPDKDGLQTVIIPNARSLMKGLANLPYLMLRDEDDLRAGLQKSMGIALELYVTEYTKDRLQHQEVLVLPEFRYSPTPGQPWDSADLTLIMDAAPVVLVEVKARRLPDKTQAEEGIVYFREIDSLATETILKGMRKYAHLADLPGRPQLATALAKAQQECLVVVVYGEYVPFFGSVWATMVHDPMHQLHTLLGNFLTLSIQEYEDHLEKAFATSTPLHALLHTSAQELKNYSGLGVLPTGTSGMSWPEKPYVEKFEGLMLDPYRLDSLPTPTTE